MTPCHYVLYHEFRHFSSHALQHNDDIHSLQLLWKCETYLITSHRDTWHPYVSYTITCYDQSEFIKFIKQSTAACLVPFTSDHLKHQHGQVWSKYEPVAWMIQSAEAATLHHASFLLIYVCNYMVQLPQKLGIFISSDNKSLFSSFRFKHP